MASVASVAWYHGATEVSDNIDWAVVPGMKLIPLSLFDLDGIVKPKQAHFWTSRDEIIAISVGDLLDDQGRYDLIGL